MDMKPNVCFSIICLRQSNLNYERLQFAGYAYSSHPETGTNFCAGSVAGRTHTTDVTSDMPPIGLLSYFNKRFTARLRMFQEQISRTLQRWTPALILWVVSFCATLVIPITRNNVDGPPNFRIPGSLRLCPAPAIGANALGEPNIYLGSLTNLKRLGTQLAPYPCRLPLFHFLYTCSLLSWWEGLDRPGVQTSLPHLSHFFVELHQLLTSQIYLSKTNV